MPNIKYFIGKIIAIPLLPVMYWQSVRIKREMPSLPEAEDTIGIIGSGSKELKLLSIGESSVAGVGVESHHRSMIGFMSKYLSANRKIRVRWEVLAKSGFTAKNVTSKLIPLLKNEAPDLIVIGLGANDTFQTNSPTSWIIDIKDLIKSIRIKYPKSPIVFINMPPIKDFPIMSSLLQFFLGNLVDIFGNELKKIVLQFDNVWYNEKRITVKEFNKLSGHQYQAHDFFSDGVHPSELTYQIWGEQMGRYIVERVL